MGGPIHYTRLGLRPIIYIGYLTTAVFSPVADDQGHIESGTVLVRWWDLKSFYLLG